MAAHMQSKRVVVFDLDGTLLDTLGDLADSANSALARHGLPVRTEEKIRQFVGDGVAALIHRAVPDGTPADLEAECLSDFRVYYLAHMTDRTRPYPGVIPLLDRLASQGIGLAVVSNKFEQAVKRLCRFYFGERICAPVGTADGIAHKPAPDGVRLALRRLDVPASGAVYVGDSETDLRTAENAGLPCVCVGWGFRTPEALRAHGATRIADSPEALEALLFQTFQREERS